METTTAKPMGALLPGIVDRPIGATVSLAPSMTNLNALALSSLPDRLDDTVLGMLRELVNSPLPAPQSCDEQHFAKCLALIDILPRRQDDQLTGKAKFALYRRILGGFSNEAISYLAEQATSKCHWFPTPAECLEILRSWPNRQREGENRDKARHLIQREMNARMDEAVEALGTRKVPQEAIDAMPTAWKRRAAEKCFLWAWPDGRFTVRRDLSAMTPEAADAEREAVATMLAQWEQITAGQDGASA